ncbi:MAG TPA: hypothetical protein PKE26_09500 [Kiritimatiellia bacterium]|nr:hypothetical protein [Kiritimatiellia bacterium]HMO99330.1 hypothetical protein [Kiritimatiellia bacterium]HMP96088.1 hypothetical protein [Kiritimatiellia bacterium]
MAALVLLGVFVFVIYRDYYIRAFSDPYNWLKFALNLPDELLASRWPYGFPLFLRLALVVTGPYAIFLINAPLLIALFLLIGRLGRWMAGERTCSGISPGWAAFALAVAADAGNVIHYVNPYRDPLSYIFLFGAMALFIRSVRRDKPLAMVASGFLLGLACSVREPSILMIVPMALYRLVSWSPRLGLKPLLRDAALFGIPFALALIPLALQTYMATSQLVLPPQAAIESKVVPGAFFNLAMLQETAGKAWGFYWSNMPALVVLAGLGLVLGMVRGQRELVFLFVPATLVYALFYSFYWTFVSRYFYVSTLLLCLSAGYAVHVFSGWLIAVLGDRYRRPAFLLIVTAIIVWSGWRLLSVPRVGDGFRIPQARAFVEDVHKHIPENAVVLAPRHMCELLTVVARRTSYPMPLWRQGDEAPEASLRRHVEDLWAADRPVFVMEIPTDDQPEGETIHLRRFADFTRVASFDPAAYRMGRYAFGPFHFYRVLPPSAREGGRRVEVGSMGRDCVVVLVDAAGAGAIVQEKGVVGVVVDGEPLETHALARDTLFVVRCPDSADILHDLDVSWRAPVPVPAEWLTEIQPIGKPLDLRFDFFSRFDHRRRWDGAVETADMLQPIPRLHGEATFAVPTPAPVLGRFVMEWRVRSSRLAPEQKARIDFYEGETFLGKLDLPLDRKVHAAWITLPRNPDQDERLVRLVWSAADAPAPDGLPPPAAEMHRVLVHRIGGGRNVDVRIGQLEDTPFIGSGFYSREGHRTAQPFRWMAGRGLLHVEVRESERDRRVIIDYDRQGMPDAVRGERHDLHVMFNDKFLTPEAEPIETTSGHLTWSARVPAGIVRGSNTVHVIAPTWTPRDHGIRDGRELSIKLTRFRLEEIYDEP